jgi:hypothetical protein
VDTYGRVQPVPNVSEGFCRFLKISEEDPNVPQRSPTFPNVPQPLLADIIIYMVPPRYRWTYGGHIWKFQPVPNVSEDFWRFLKKFSTFPNVPQRFPTFPNVSQRFLGNTIYAWFHPHIAVTWYGRFRPSLMFPRVSEYFWRKSQRFPTFPNVSQRFPTFPRNYLNVPNPMFKPKSRHM